MFTGQVPARGIAPGECIEIATGAPMPAGADAVVMVEETERASGDDVVRVSRRSIRARTSGAAAPTSRRGQTVVARGQVLNPSRIGALAATGVTTVEVFARPSVAHPLDRQRDRRAGSAARPGQIYDVNRFTLEAIVGRHGGTTVIAADRRRLDRRAVERADRRARRTTSSCSRAAARSASAI